MGVGADGKDLSSQFPVTFQNVRVWVGEAQTVFQAGGVRSIPMPFSMAVFNISSMMSA